MRKILLLLMFPLISYIAIGQHKEDAEKLVNEGIAYHDKGDYEGAIVRYDKALLLDKDNLLALAEKSMTLLATEKFDDAILCCQRAIEKNPGEKDLRYVYVTYGNAYDGLKKTDRAIEVYDEGLKQFPDFYQLHFNRGVSFSSVKKYDQAISCFQKSVSLNPKHASSHNGIARLLDMKGKRIPALLAYSRFLILEPESKRSNGNLENALTIVRGNVEKTGKNSITININSDMLSDTTADGKASENSFAATDLILSMSASLDYSKENKKDTEVEKFIKKMETVCASLKETKKDNYGFYWDYYVPYFIEMKDKKLIETFAYIAFASSDDPNVAKWLKSHKTDINAFYDWSKNFNWATK